MANLFRSVKPTKVKRTPFNLSHEVKLTTEFGHLTPILCEEVLPGDTFKVNTEMLMRTAPLYGPVMHRVNVYVHYFFVANRLVMDDWDVFITGGKDMTGNKEVRFGNVLPVSKNTINLSWYYDALRRVKGNDVVKTLLGERSLFDNLGFPAIPTEFIDSTSRITDLSQLIDLLPFKVYQLVSNSFYRDENYQDEIDIFKDVNGDLYEYLRTNNIDLEQSLGYINALLSYRTRNWEKDYFTSALPTPQRGDPDGVRASADGTESPITAKSDFLSTLQDQTGADIIPLKALASELGFSPNLNINFTVNELRRAMAMQRFKEKSMRFGSRFTEFLRGVFGVTPSDARLQRPEFLGGGKIPLNFGEVLQTSEDNKTPLGSYGGRAIAGGVTPSFKGFFEEHGFVLGIMSVMPKPAYMQGWPRKFDRFDMFDYMLPDFSHLGEQEIKQKELFFNFDAVSEHNNSLFGYTPRYAEYRFSPSRVHGDFRRPGLDSWHLARKFSGDYNGDMLNKSFLQVKSTDLNRIFNVEDASFSDHFWIQLYNDVKVIRKLPKFGTPMM